MSEDLHHVPGEPEEPGQPEQFPQPEQAGQAEQLLAEASFAEEPGREAPPAPAVPREAQPVQPVSESVIPEQPAERPAYPPLPEFYAQMPAVDPNRPPAGPVWPAPGVPAYQPAPGMPMYPPPMPGAPLQPLPPGYMYVPVNQGFKYDFPPIPPVAPQPLGQAVRDLPRQYKKIVFKPGVRSFLEEQGRAEWGIIWIQLLFQVFLGAVLSIPDFLFLNKESATSTTAGLPPNFFLLEIMTLVILAPAFFFAGVGIQYLLARMFKGNGSFKQQAYNQLLYSIPLGIVSSVAGTLFFGLTSGSSLLTVYLNPTSGATAPGTAFNGGELIVLLIFYLVSLGLGIYEIVLNVFSIMATHRITGGKASAVVLLPIAAAYVLTFIVFFIVAAVLVAYMPTVR